MEKKSVDIDFKEVTRRIELEMEGYTPGEWAKKVGVKTNVISNIHSPKARQRPSFNYIIAVAVATNKSLEYFLWGKPLVNRLDPQPYMIGEELTRFQAFPEQKRERTAASPDREMGKRVRFWREDIGMGIPELARRTELPAELLKEIEAGHHTTTDIIIKVAAALRCSVDFILGCGSPSACPPLKVGKKKKGKKARGEDLVREDEAF